MSQTILIIDDEKTIRWSLSEALRDSGYEVFDAGTADQGIRIFKEKTADLVLLDLKLPGASGIDVLKEIKAIDPSTPVVMMTAYGEVETAVEAMKNAAYDFILKPFALEKIKITISNALEAFRLKSEIAYLNKKTSRGGVFNNFIGQSKSMLDIFEKVRKIGESKANTILITGETGTGKELVARAIHACSYKESRPFMEINCAAVPENLLESELFGHERGAFTDAKTRKKGLVELAEGGTLFLDEIGEMGITLQARLLRLLENKTFRRVGGVMDLYVNTRIISATNRDLSVAIEEKLFRKDLYYRLKVIPIHIPPLRERKEDIPLLVSYFVERLNRELGKRVQPVKREVLEALLAYEWMGNIRELRNVIERAMLLDADEEILLDHLPPEIRGTESGADDAQMDTTLLTSFFPMTLREVEKIQIKKTLEQTSGNKSKAANILGISRQTLREKLKVFIASKAAKPDGSEPAGDKETSAPPTE